MPPKERHFLRVKGLRIIREFSGFGCGEVFVDACEMILYERYGFKFTEEKESTAFGKRLREQRYGFAQKLEFLRSCGTK